MAKIEVQKVATLEGHRDSIFTVIKGRTDAEFFSASGDGMIVSWDLTQPKDGHLVAKVENSVYALALAPDNQHLVIGHNFEGLHVVDLASKFKVNSVSLNNAAIFAIEFLGSQLMVAQGDGSVHVVSWPSLEKVWTGLVATKSARCIHHHENDVVIGCSDHQVRILDSTSREVKHVLEGHTNSVFTSVFSPDGNFLLTSGRDAHLKVWDRKNNYQLVEDIVAHMYAINHIAFDPNGTHFATCSMDKSIKVWDAASFQLLKVIDKARHAGHGTSINKLHWSTHLNQLVSCSDDRTLSVWDIKY